MAVNGKYVHKIGESSTTIVATNAWDVSVRKDLPMPQDPGSNGMLGKLSCARISGTVHDPAAKTITIVFTYNQAGTLLWLEEKTVDIMHAPFGTGWRAIAIWDTLIRVTPSECPEGTVSAFIKTDSATATCTEIKLLWEE